MGSGRGLAESQVKVEFIAETMVGAKEVSTLEAVEMAMPVKKKIETGVGVMNKSLRWSRVWRGRCSSPTVLSQLVP